jgi:hypothetical protein
MRDGKENVLLATSAFTLAAMLPLGRKTQNLHCLKDTKVKEKEKINDYLKGYPSNPLIYGIHIS